MGLSTPAISKPVNVVVAEPRHWIRQCNMYGGRWRPEVLASINCLVLLLRVLEAEARKFEHHDAHAPAKAKVKRRGYN